MSFRVASAGTFRGVSCFSGRSLTALVLAPALVMGALGGARAQPAMPDASALRAEAERRLGGTLESVAGAPVAPRVPSGPAFPGAGVLGDSIFSVPVGGGAVPRPIHAEVLHDVIIVLLPQWNVMQTFVGDPARWRVSHTRSLVIVQPGERGAQTNLSVVLSTGDVLQFDLIEVSPYAGVPRTGRVYVGSEPWLLERVFSLLPIGVGQSILDSGVSVPDLLADPAGVVYTHLYGRPGGLGSPAPAPVRTAPAPIPSRAPVSVPAPASEPEPFRAPAAPSPAPALEDPAVESIDAGPPVPSGPPPAAPPAPDPPSESLAVPSATAMPPLPPLPGLAAPRGASPGFGPPVPAPPVAGPAPASLTAGPAAPATPPAAPSATPAGPAAPATVSPPGPGQGRPAAPSAASAGPSSPPGPSSRVSAGDPAPSGLRLSPDGSPGPGTSDPLPPFSPGSPLFDDPVFDLPAPGGAGPPLPGSPAASQIGQPGPGASSSPVESAFPAASASSSGGEGGVRPARVDADLSVRVSMTGAITPSAAPAAQRFPVAQPAGSPPTSLWGDSLSEPVSRDLFVSSDDLDALRARRDGLRRQIADARRSTGDQVAEAALGIDRDLEYLRVSYPSRIQMSFYWNPEMPPLAPPFWLYGLWHDTDNTFIRLLAPDPVFRDETLGLEIEPDRMDTYLYRLPGIVDEGSVTVPSGRGFVRAFWTRFDETEGR